MAKKRVGSMKLQVKAGQANPSPPVGPALGQRGINIMEFCKAFNAKQRTWSLERLAQLLSLTIRTNRFLWKSRRHQRRTILRKQLSWHLELKHLAVRWLVT